MPRLIFIFIFFSASCFCQNKTTESSILIFSSEPGFLRPYIESTIKELKDVNFDLNYFDEIYSLNTLDEDIEIRSKVARILWSQENASDIISNRPTNDSDKEFQDDILRKLTGYDYFLTVKTNTLGELIEFQFQLYSTLDVESKKNEKTYLRRVLVDNVLSTENFFINPKNPGYLDDIKNAIYRLFQGSNKKPVARLKIHEQNVFNNDTVIVPYNTMFSLDGSYSYDLDSEKIRYFFKNLPKENENYQTFDKVKFDSNDSIQLVQLEKLGLYKIQFSVFDDISESEKITFFLKSVEPEESIDLLYDEDADYSYSTARYPLPQTDRNAVFSINTNGSNLNDVIITNKEIGLKYVKSLNEKNIVEFKIEDSTQTQDGMRYKVSIDSRFNDYPSIKENDFFAYRMSQDSVLSKPKKMTHKYIHRGIGTLSLVTSSTIVNGWNASEINIAGDTIVNNNSSFVLNLEGSVFLSPRIELGGSFPIYSKGELELENIKLKPHSSISLFTNYYFLNNNSHLEMYLGVGGGLSNFSYKNIEDSFEVVYLHEARFGVQMEMTFFSAFSVSYGFRIIYGRYNKSIFNNLYYSDLGFVIKARI